MAEKAKVLIVDDDLSVLESFKMILGLKDYEIDTAEGMEQAAASSKKQHYDVAFVDLRFNGKEIGLDILAKLKEIDPAIEVIICTAFASEKSKIRAVQLGAMDYISKPFMMELIYDLVERVMDRKKKKK